MNLLSCDVFQHHTWATSIYPTITILVRHLEVWDTNDLFPAFQLYYN